MSYLEPFPSYRGVGYLSNYHFWQGGEFTELPRSRWTHELWTGSSVGSIRSGVFGGFIIYIAYDPQYNQGRRRHFENEGGPTILQAKFNYVPPLVIICGYHRK